MAEAVVEERQLLKTLRWYDGFVICLANPGFLLGSLGNSVLDMGGWGAMIVWAITAALIFPVTIIYSELAAMFPKKSGGLAIYANEGWRKYTTVIGPIGTFGYWIGWSVVLSFLGLFIGSIAQGAWFPGQPFGTNAFGGKCLAPCHQYFSTGPVHVGLQHLIAIGLILAVWVFNVLGTRIAVTFNYLAGVLLLVPLFCFTLLPLINGKFTTAGLHNNIGAPGHAWGGLQIALVWIWLMIWSTAPEAAATFAPEYKDTVRDTRKALVSSAAFILLINTVVPLTATGGAGETIVGGSLYVQALQVIVGKGAWTNFLVVVLCASFVLSMNTATADGSRALYGISKDGMTIKQLGRLNRFNVPGNAMSLDMVINILFVLFVGNIFGILAASNIGYVLANAFALGAFVLLRKDRPNWPRPIKLPSYWVPIAVALCALFLVFTVVGVGWFQIAAGGYGKGAQIKIIGFGVLAISLVLFLFRRIVQDGERPHWREETPTMPDEEPSEVVAAPGVPAT